MRLATHPLRAATTAPSLLLFALALLAGSASAQSVKLPATFEESIDYELSDFGGAVSTLITDPTDATNTVVQTVRGATADCFAGTTLASTTGFSEPIPVAPGATTMSVRVWSPEAGVRVRFKPENLTDPEVFVEADAFTTAAMQWETLVFDFAGQPASSDDREFTKASIFFDFQCGVAGLPAAERTYYWDDVAFGAGDGASGDQTAIVINEVDADTPGTDAAEFVEFYNPSSEAVSLDGLAVVFFNGSNDQSYAAFDLTGTLAAGGYYVLGNPGVPNVNQTFDPGNSGFLQNGADAVALYTGSSANFQNGTAATTTNLVDAVVYDTDDNDDAGLLAALGQTVQYNEAAKGDKDNQSVQRSPDGADAFIVALATPGAANPLAEPETFSTILLGANEVPPVTTGAAGGVTAVLTGTNLVVTGQFGGLKSDYNANIGSHLHGGAANENRPVEYVLDPTLDANNRGGRFEAENNTFTLRPTFADSLRGGLVYVNVHTVDQPGGEIRGQLLTETPTASVTLAQARTIGAGFSVSLSGTVSRAMGDFSYVQDDDGALTVRQTSGDYAAAVAAGTIAAGTAVDLTGTLSEFNGLLQINNADLSAFTVGATGAAPTPEVVTLAQLAADGEAYESRLVSVVDVTFTDANGTFAAGQEYEISQGTDKGTVRIGEAGETALVGTAIPRVGQLVGVVNERSGAYPILPVAATDVTAGGTAGETGPEGDVSLTVANPLRGAATVRFELAAPGRATVALFDALGRQVALLVDGAVGAGEQTATLDAGALATGVYVLRLQTERGTASRTLTVVR